MVPSLDRLSRSLQDLITMVGDLRKREVGFTSLHEKVPTRQALQREVPAGRSSKVKAGAMTAVRATPRVT